MLTKSELVLDLFDDDQSFDEVVYGNDHPVLFISQATYTDMGRPARITVTIQPGDRLNTEEN